MTEIKELTKTDLFIICGHYGCGKTNLAINLAVKMKEEGNKVTLVDLDLVNPYFRTADYKDFLQQRGIEVFTPMFAGSNLDLPIVPLELEGLLSGREDHGKIILDAGGDDAGAIALGRFAPLIMNRDHEFWYIINRSRPLTASAKDAADLLKEIEAASRLKATAVINNTHLQQQTTAELIADSAAYAEQTAKLLDLPLLFHTASAELVPAVAGLMPAAGIFSLQIYVKPPWEGSNNG